MRPQIHLKIQLTAFAALAGMIACPKPGVAQSVADFYRGKTIQLLVGVNVGAAYDLQGRLIARHMRNHIPGNPNIVAQNMVGAGGLKMANYLYNQAPQDGLSLGMLGNTLPASQAVGASGLGFDARKFNWIGAISSIVMTMTAWKATGIRDIEDARYKETIAAASARGAITYTFPAMMNAFLGTKFRIVTGYEGLSDMSLAIERREADVVASSWSGWKTTKPNWIAEGKLTILAQMQPKSPELPGIPAVEELAKNDDDRRVVEIIISGSKLGFPLVASPGAPPERVAALRAAFEATMKDPAFLKEAEAMKLYVEPVIGARLAAIVDDLINAPKYLRDRARPVIGD